MNQTCKKSAIVALAWRILMFFTIYSLSSFLTTDAKRSRHRYAPLKSDNCKECGQSFVDSELIMNGTIVDPRNKYPWSVLLKTKKGNVLCGGAILNEYYIIAAAHCFPKWKKPADVKVFVHTPDKKKLTEAPPVETLYPHPDYYSTTHLDIGLVKLKHPITCSDYVAPACLPPEDFEAPVDTIFQVIGWGKTNVKKQPEDMLESTLKVLPKETCRKIRNAKYYLNTTYCVRGENGTSPCHGDSGSPAFKSYNNKTFVLGVTSTGTSITCDAGARMIYTSVSSFMDWIKNVTSLESTPITEKLTVRQKKKKHGRRIVQTNGEARTHLSPMESTHMLHGRRLVKYIGRGSNSPKPYGVSAYERKPFHEIVLKIIV